MSELRMLECPDVLPHGLLFALDLRHAEDRPHDVAGPCLDTGRFDLKMP